MKENTMTQGTRFGPFLVGPHKRSGKLTGRWQVTIPKAIAGKRTRRYFESKKMAEDYAKKLRTEYNRGRLTLPQPTPKERITFRQAVAEWKVLQKDRVGARRKRNTSLKTDTFRLNHALAFFGDERIADISDNRLLHYQKHRLDAGKSPATVNSDLKKVKQVLTWACRKKKWIDTVPDIEPEPEGLSEEIVPTMDEVTRIIEHLSDRLKLLVTFMAATGCRSGEAFNLTWDRLDVDECFVRFEPKDGWTPKTRSSVRRVPITKELMDLIQRTKHNGKYVFKGKHPEKPISNMRKAFGSAVKKANIRRKGESIPVTPHTIRKAYATYQAIHRKMPPRLLKALLGHSPNSEVTDRYYVIPQEDDLRMGALDMPTELMKGVERGLELGNNVATGQK